MPMDRSKPEKDNHEVTNTTVSEDAGATEVRDEETETNARRDSWIKRMRQRHQRQRTAKERRAMAITGSHNVIRLFIPVTICMTMVVFTVKTAKYFQKQRQPYPYTPFQEYTDDAATLAWQAIVNALLVISVVAVMTFALVLLYKFKFYKLLHGWLMFSSLSILFLLTFTYTSIMLQNYNIPADLITYILFIWNFGIVGLICVHWNGPLILQQFYLLIMSALTALILLSFLPDWTTWALLGALVIWDLVAVLCPGGPLKMLVETAQDRDEPFLPGLIYSSTVMWSYVTMADTNGDQTRRRESSDGHDEDRENKKSAHAMKIAESNPQLDTSFVAGAECDDIKPTRAKQTRTKDGGEVKHDGTDDRRSEPGQERRVMSQSQPHGEEEEEVERGVKLGLGDFVFYSVLVGKASITGDWTTTLACFVSILIGLVSTLLLLAIAQKALPALPISITFGLVFYFSTTFFVQPFTDVYSSQQVFI